MKVAVIVYHKNVTRYPKHWIQMFVDSIEGQTYKEFDILEYNYGDSDDRLFLGMFRRGNLPTFVHAMNYLIQYALDAGYDCIVNSNIDDWYDKQRLQKQLPYLSMCDLVSCNFSLIQDDKLIKTHQFDKLDLKAELARGHNIICHPGVIYNKSFFEGHGYLPEEIPYEDLKLWQRAVVNKTFYICPQNLCFHRIHSGSVCQSQNR